MAKMKMELSIPTEFKDKPIVYMIGRDFNIVPNIIEASFSTTIGWMVLTIEGEQADLDKFLAFCKEHSISVKKI